MTENGDPLENAIAKRINGIIKNEYLLHQPLLNKQHAMQLLKQTVKVYNKHRPHLSCNMLTPEEIHHQQQMPKKTMEKLLQEKHYSCQPFTGLRTTCKPISGFII